MTEGKQFACFRAVIVAHFCGRWTFFVLFSWLPIYFQDAYPTQQVGRLHHNFLDNHTKETLRQTAAGAEFVF
jgi:hypothetical protein